MKLHLIGKCRKCGRKNNILITEFSEKAYPPSLTIDTTRINFDCEECEEKLSKTKHPSIEEIIEKINRGLK